MNLRFELMQGLMAFVAIFTVSNVLLGRSIEEALGYALAGGFVMALTMGYLSRDVTEHVANVSVPQAADAASSLLGGSQTPNPDGSITVQTGFNYFWLSVRIEPAKGGVTLRGSANHIRHVKYKLLGG